IHRNQCGSLPALSSFDACLSLVDTVRTLQRPGLKVSSLFLDIKGGFDNVDSSVLTSFLSSKGTPGYLVAWIRSFLSQRSCRLLLQGSPRTSSPVSVGTPQGSPVSPLLFVIYVSSLHIPLARGLVLSYVDDFSLTVSSRSYRTNIRLLQAAFLSVKSKALERKVSFSIPKTELIHWRTPKQRDPQGSPRPPPIYLDGQLFHPSRCLRWLGYWLSAEQSTSPHFSRKLALSQAAFATVKRLSPPGTGLAPHLAHRLSYALLLPILLYGADLLVPTKGMLGKMKVFWRQVQRWTTNCFRTTPTTILAAEACLPPISVLVSHKRRMAALRLVCAAPSINPAAARLCCSFPSMQRFRAPDAHRALCTKLQPNVMPLNWRSKLPRPPVRTHLPVDALAHLTLPLLEGLSFTPLFPAHLLPREEGPLPPNDIMTAAYRG